MQLKPEEISKLIKEQIKHYENKISQADTGTVIMIGDGIARASGLDKCMANELLRFSNGEYGMALNLEENSVAIVMLGSLPAAELLRRGLSRPLRALGRKLCMDDRSFAALLVGFVSAAPAINMLRDMDERGKIMNAAFLVCGASALAAHLGFTMAVERSMILPLLLTKLTGGLMGAVLALLLTRKTIRNAPVS